MGFENLTWAVGEGVSDDAPILLRFREFCSSFDRGKYKERLNIFWDIAVTDNNGLPSEEDQNLMSSFEERLIAAVEFDEHSVLALVLTGKGQREYVFQSTHTDEFIQRLSNMPQEKMRYPIRIQHYTDVNWDYIERVISDFGDSKGFTV